MHPGFAGHAALSRQEGAGKAGCRRHPRPAARRHAQKRPHSSIQVKPNTRPSLRDGRTAYAALSREPNVLLASLTSRTSPIPAPVGTRNASPRLDRGNDDQDHTVLPHARSGARPTRLGRGSRVRLNPSPALHFTSATTPLRPPQPDPRLATTYDRPSSWIRMINKYAKSEFR